MDVKLIAHTALSDDFRRALWYGDGDVNLDANDRAAVALTAIRTCYSPLKPSEVVAKEGAKYFGQSASDGEGGAESDRLFRHIIRSKHTSTLEHISYTFAIEGVSRSLLAQLTRHRVGFSFSVQSQRYVKFGSDDKIGGFDYVTPPSISGSNHRSGEPVGYGTTSGKYGPVYKSPTYVLDNVMERIQDAYDELRSMGVPAEDARYVLPNAATCNIVMTANLRALIEFYGKRRPGNGAQWEIADLSERLREEVMKVDGWADGFFDEN